MAAAPEVPTDPLHPALLDACPQLKAVCSMAVGYNNVDVPACTAHGVVVSNAPDVLTETHDVVRALATGERVGRKAVSARASCCE